MKKYEVEIKGIQPIIWNVLKKEIEDEKKQLKSNELGEWEEKRENWMKKAEYNNKGELVIPERWIKGAMITSCKKNRIVPHFATRKNETYTSYVESFMIVNKKEYAYNKSKIVAFSSFVGAQGKNSSTKVWRCRPMLKEWKSSYEILDPIGRMDIKELQQILEFAGLMIGIGDNRINNFGRFETTKITEVKR